MALRVKNIEFIPCSETVPLVVPSPIPAKKFIPEWYKSAPVFDPKKPDFAGPGKEVKNLGIKRCMPFLDALTAGYIQTTWCDIYIESSNGAITVRSASGPDIILARESSHVDMGPDFYNIEFTWKTPWLPKLESGYSVMLSHPVNRFDLPFITLTGIIDSDVFYHTPSGNLPFYIRKGFSGLIPEGTPMYQIIPIKRDSWKSSVVEYDNAIKKNFNESFKKFWGFYKNNFWNKKEYN